eukprot:GHUV01039494.1.p1 GENE.GHUV01039494.1~~GHUV01039494.1.p1  ORF type:complete len:145 (-),score=24.44 GHUV01039494.1:381-815(-)
MGQPYGGVFLFTQSARMMRPVRYWAGGGGLELLGTLEQATLDIHCPDGGAGGTPGVRFTHGELSAGEQGTGWGFGTFPFSLVCLLLWRALHHHLLAISKAVATVAWALVQHCFTVLCIMTCLFAAALEDFSVLCCCSKYWPQLL